jgi:aldehyde:ferredoxin oxidoreductase
MAELYGWAGKILRVDLTEGKITTVPTANYVPKWIGGRGLGAKIHWDEVPPEVKAFDPANVITFILGPMTGTMTSGACRTAVQAVSPQTYPIEHYTMSKFGGHWGPELRFAGYDGIIVQGKAPNPVYLLIEDGVVEIRDARALWGLDTYATQQNLWERHGHDHRIATIGPAGENLCRNAIIITDDSSVTGLGSFGSVMGSKNLKAIVVRGTGGVPVAKPKDLLELAYTYQRISSRKEGEAGSDGKIYLPGNYCRGALKSPVASADSVLRAGIGRGGLAGTSDKVRIGFSACFGCSVHCGMSVKFLDGSNVGSGHITCAQVTTHPEEVAYQKETKGRDWYARLKMQDMLGVSTFDFTVFGGSAAWLYPLIQAGILTRENTGLPVDKIGSLELHREYLYKYAYRKGIGDKLAEGPLRFCNEYLGTDAAKAVLHRFATVSGRHSGVGVYPGTFTMDYYKIPGIIIRATSTTGGTDQRGTYASTWLTYIDPESFKPGTDEYAKFIDARSKRFYGSEQAVRDMVDWKWGPNATTIAITLQNYKIWNDSYMWCFVSTANTYDAGQYTPDHLGCDLSFPSRLYSAVTGIDFTLEEQTSFCNRVWMLERAILTRQGHTSEDDWYFDEMFEDYKKEPYLLTKEKLRAQLDDFYAARGLDVATGKPTRRTLEALGLKDVADELEKKYGVTVPP